MKTFQSDIRKWTEKTKRATLAVFRESSQRLIQEANTPRGMGGNMPVDTGFLRGSVAGSKSGMPGQGAAPPEIVLLTTRLGDSIWMGWTANYAIYMEARYGFMRSAAQNWNYIVANVTHEVRSRYG